MNAVFARLDWAIQYIGAAKWHLDGCGYWMPRLRGA
jgi:hypothetical protein